MAETLTIVVDDTDGGISYSGDWMADKGSLDNLGDFGAPMMSTSHFIKGTGSFSYTFSGTYVGVFGSSVDGSNPSRVCTVDGTTIPNNQITAPANGILHCQVFNLADGKHTLVVTVPSANPNGYWFDNLLYIPSASVSRANAAVMVRWDDPSFSFGPQWSQTGFGQLVTANDASMSVQFTGRVATWMGYYLDGQLSSATTATYTVDGGSPMSFDLMAIQTKLVGGDSNQRFFTTGLLPQGSHTLRVTYNGNSGTTPLAIYSLIVQNGASADMSIGGAIGASHPVQVVVTSSNGGAPVTATSTSPDASPPSIPSTQSPSVVVVGTGSSAVTITVAIKNPNSNSTATPIIPSSTTGSSLVSFTQTDSSGAPIFSNNASSGSASISSTTGAPSNSDPGNTSTSDSPSGALNKGHNHLGAILGAVIGVLGLLLLLLTLVLCKRARKRRGRNNDDTGVQPFPSPPPMSEVSAAIDNSNSSRGKFAPFSNDQFYSDVKQPLPSDAVAGMRSSAASPALQRQEESSEPISQSSRSPIPASLPPAAPTTPGESEVVVLHEDSGVRIPMNSAERPNITVVEMPPTYSAT